MLTVYDSFGHTLQEGDRVAWIGNPSFWCREIRKGKLVSINVGAGRHGAPTLTVRADENEYSAFFELSCKDSVLTVCSDISALGQSRTHFRFGRVIRL